MVRTANQLPPAGPCRVKPDEAPGTFSEGLGGRRTRVDEKQEGNAPAFTGRLCHPQDRDKDVHTCSADFHSLAMRAFSLTGKCHLFHHLLRAVLGPRHTAIWDKGQFQCLSLHAQATDCPYSSGILGIIHLVLFWFWEPNPRIK